ncbi:MULTISPECIES: glycosyltransferase family 2 protein [unclassified Mesorhizobium]|uniref:glycosyltransferase family 2 protein n=1 Tax=unclassified Mesorhizobium TaxID=325217 RepID=UPI00112ECF93|nr:MULTISPECIES: glycosyltransferase family 2 protein [unclassified Mesorhizobium]TPI52598.1 glycosyltransferase family 2 protein [Mesorhizobium sp. B3-1-7]UCI24296.1 glycosyltransferase [Mesorhizobium sp. B2-8-5]
MEQAGQGAAIGPIEPLVSVVIATHNRPAVLHQTLKSLVGQTLQDWEAMVIGDACRPDTATTVAAFGDARISYIDLPVNFGEQSGPNNIGFARARGRFVAILNHDDLWFPDHLTSMSGWIDATGADVVIARGAVIESAASKGSRHMILGTGRHGFYDPVTTVGFGSAQMVRRTSLPRLGPWRPASQCVCESSQDWLFRAWRNGAVIATMPHLTVLMLHSGKREGSYARDTAQEQEELMNAMSSPDALRVRILGNAEEPAPLKRFRYLKRRLLAALGIHPRARSFRRQFRHGAFIAMLRQTRGLPPMPEREPDAEALLARYRHDSERPEAG